MLGSNLIVLIIVIGLLVEFSLYCIMINAIELAIIIYKILDLLYYYTLSFLLNIIHIIRKLETSPSSYMLDLCMVSLVVMVQRR